MCECCGGDCKLTELPKVLILVKPPVKSNADFRRWNDQKFYGIIDISDKD